MCFEQGENKPFINFQKKGLVALNTDLEGCSEMHVKTAAVNLV